jgi:hypothetical protein
MNLSMRPLGPLCGVLALATVALAQVATPPVRGAGRTFRDPALAFLEPYGLQNFSDHHVEALSTLLAAQAQYDAGEFSAAKSTLDALWADHPSGHWSWGSLPSKPFGINIGSPPCYYSLRMLSDTTDWRVANPQFTQASRSVRLTVVLVGKSSGIEPRDLQEIQQGTGVPVQHVLDPLLLADGSKVVHESLHLFREYVVAMTEGGLDVETRVLHLPDLDLPVHATTLSGRFYAGPTDASALWYDIDQADIDATDWWWLIYPSHVPEQYPDFQGAEFVTGGMGTGPEGRSPYFVIDDRWLVRKPPHIGSGPYSKIEREAYLPQWLQHEFFHHLFRTYPEFGLEATPHQWFNLSTWPPDFQGRYEADYFHEALYKRLQTATHPLTSALRYATADAPWHLFDVDELLGDYQRSPILNNWHVGTIQLGPQLEWQNLAGVDWNLTDDIARGHLLTGPDCPYYTSGWLGTKFDVVLKRDALGDFLPELEGFSFLGELYERVGP